MSDQPLVPLRTMPMPSPCGQPVAFVTFTFAHPSWAVDTTAVRHAASMPRLAPMSACSSAVAPRDAAAPAARSSDAVTVTARAARDLRSIVRVCPDADTTTIVEVSGTVYGLL